MYGEFLSGLVVQIMGFSFHGLVSVLLGNIDPAGHAAQPKKEKERKKEIHTLRIIEYPFVSKIYIYIYI